MHPISGGPHRFATSFTLRQVKAAFATQGILLQRMPSGPSKKSKFVVLTDAQGPFGYQLTRPIASGVRYMVFVVGGGSGHKARFGDVLVWYGDGSGPAVRAALRRLQ